MSDTADQKRRLVGFVLCGTAGIFALIVALLVSEVIHTSEGSRSTMVLGFGAGAVLDMVRGLYFVVSTH
jgi:hypothetical protein